MMENTQKNKSDEVLILNNSAKMFKERWRRGTWITGTIGTKGISKNIKIGDIISIEDLSITVRHIIVNHFIKDMADREGTKLPKKGL